MKLPDYSAEYQRMEQFRFKRLFVEHLRDHHGVSHNEAEKWMIEAERHIEQMLTHRRAIFEK